LIAAGSLSRLAARLDSVEVGTISGRVLDFLRLRKGTLDRARLVRILGRLRSRVAVKPLAGLLLDRSEPDVHLLKTVVAALAAIGGASAFHAIVESLTDPRAYVRHAAAQALREESGKNPRFDARDPDPESISKYRGRWEEKFGRKWTER
jgi:HEAT repeat protein